MFTIHTANSGCFSNNRKFSNVFGSSRLLGNLSLSPPGMRRKEDQTAATRAKFAKEREVRHNLLFLSYIQRNVSHRATQLPNQHSLEVAAKCLEQAFLFASENLDSIGLPLVQLLGKNMRCVVSSSKYYYVLYFFN